MVRPVEPADAGDWIRLRSELWPVGCEDHPPEVAKYFSSPPRNTICLIARSGGGVALGFAEVGLRDYAEDCATSPVGYLEGIYVVPDRRGTGVGRALVRAGEAWARDRGCSEMASDRELTNEASGAFHEAVGFEETVRLVAYRKELGRTAGASGAPGRRTE